MIYENRWFRRLLFGLLVVLSYVESSTANEASIKFSVKQQAFGGGGIYLPASFRGHKFKILLDTGASATYLIPSDWNANLPVLGKKLAKGINGIPSICLKLDLSDLKIFPNVSSAEKVKFVEGLKCQENNGDNILGINYLYGGSINIDFKLRSITLGADSAGYSNSSSEFVKLNNGDGLLGVPVSFGSSTVVGLFDTGAAISAVDLKYIQQHKNEFELMRQNSLSTEASGKAVRAGLYKIKNVSIGNSTVLHNIYAISYDFSSLQQAFGENLIAIVGYNIISRYRWNIDLRSEKRPIWQAE